MTADLNLQLVNDVFNSKLSTHKTLFRKTSYIFECNQSFCLFQHMLTVRVNLHNIEISNVQRIFSISARCLFRKDDLNNCLNTLEKCRRLVVQ